MRINCCKATHKHKQCTRKSDNKVFKLRRRFTRKRCMKGVKGFTMRSSCAPYKNCSLKKKNYKGGSKSKKAVAVIDMNGIKGVVRFSSKRDKCRIAYEITGLNKGEHGFHVHRCGDMTRGCSSGCEHFNPLNSVHGGPHSNVRHAGDLGNIKSNGKIAKGTVTVKNLSCDSKSRFSIIGRMIVLHKDRDDLGFEATPESLKTGNAGKRIACAIIGITD